MLVYVCSCFDFGYEMHIPIFEIFDMANRREYTRNLRSVEVRKCWPFSGDVTGELIQSLLPPITVPKFRWWSHELASLLTKSPVTPDDSDPAFRRKAKAKSRPCKKRSVAEIARREDERDDSEVLIGSKRKKTKDHGALQKKKLSDSLDAKTAIKVSEYYQIF